MSGRRALTRAKMFYADEATHKALRLEAWHQGVPQAQLLRAACREYLEARLAKRGVPWPDGPSVQLPGQLALDRELEEASR